DSTAACAISAAEQIAARITSRVEPAKVWQRVSPAPHAREGSGDARLIFREGRLSLLHMHWDHEPADRAVASWTAPVLWRFRLAGLQCQSARRLAHSKTWRGFQRIVERRPICSPQLRFDHGV